MRQDSKVRVSNERVKLSWIVRRPQKSTPGGSNSVGCAISLDGLSSRGAIRTSGSKQALLNPNETEGFAWNEPHAFTSMALRRS